MSITIDHLYDSLYRLTEANYSIGDFYHYTYDAVGNRLTHVTTVSCPSSPLPQNERAILRQCSGQVSSL
ncbi:MAG: RHS repeat protein [Anaerolineae bacterium]|nr:RHS repeat protein [Anaerolineae bacterium]MBL8105759.1 RHS repeat protein [Anaerolineales bacterium]MCC7189647.1 RHS repeat protein [Anaerolineales bacterium]